MRRVVMGTVILLGLVTGCESEQARYERLERERGTACLAAWAQAQQGNTATSNATAACAVAERRLAKFMRGD